MENEFLLMDRLQKIKQVINEYGIDNFYISFSGGKDSTVLSELIDMAIPNNKMPRVFADTGIELDMIKAFVKSKAENDNRFIIIKPTQNIKKVLEEYGYPFKSKEHSLYLSVYQNNKDITKSVYRYLYPEEKRKSFGCIKALRYQFTDSFNLKISKKCCDKLKKEPMKRWAKENNKSIVITGIRSSEGGLRSSAKCVVFQNNKAKYFNPLSVVPSSFEDWFIKTYNINICDIYKDPYNFDRTGCKGCPFNVNLQKDLDTLEKFFPNERKQCEIIWKPVYDEYRRIKYRLKK